METPGTRREEDTPNNPAEPGKEEHGSRTAATNPDHPLRSERLYSILEPTPIVIFVVGLLLARFGHLIGLILMILPATAERLPLMGVICVVTGYAWFLARLLFILTGSRPQRN